MTDLEVERNAVSGLYGQTLINEFDYRVLSLVLCFFKGMHLIQLYLIFTNFNNRCVIF